MRTLNLPTEEGKVSKRGYEMREVFGLIIIFLLTSISSVYAQNYLGNLSINPYDPNSFSNLYGAGSPYNPNSPKNPYGTYGNPYISKSATNPYTMDAPKVYDQQGNFRGKLSSNIYDPDSITNEFGRFGSPFSPNSLKNPFGAGNQFAPDSPYNLFGSGWRVFGTE